jgi:hypothetical protein
VVSWHDSLGFCLALAGSRGWEARPVGACRRRPSWYLAQPGMLVVVRPLLELYTRHRLWFNLFQIVPQISMILRHKAKSEYNSLKSLHGVSETAETCINDGDGIRNTLAITRINLSLFRASLGCASNLCESKAHWFNYWYSVPQTSDVLGHI